jgi:hypothetical protein
MNNLQLSLKTELSVRQRIKLLPWICFWVFSLGGVFGGFLMGIIYFIGGSIIAGSIATAIALIGAGCVSMNQLYFDRHPDKYQKLLKT